MKNYTTFKYPYLLIEDAKGKCQPIYKEYTKEIPSFRLDSPPLCCPFTNARRSTGAKRKPFAKSGFCEICYVKFEDYDEHVTGTEHREFGDDDYNYRSIDVFIKDMLEQELFGGSNYTNSPCEKLEAKYSAFKQVYFSPSDENDNLIRISKGSTDNYDETVDFEIILSKINKKEGPLGK